MNHSLRSIALCAVFAAAPFACFAQTSAPADATAVAPCVGSIGNGAFERRVVEKSRQGVAALRDYLWVTRGMHNVSLEEAVAFADQARSCASMTSLASAR